MLLLESIDRNYKKYIIEQSIKLLLEEDDQDLSKLKDRVNLILSQITTEEKFKQLFSTEVFSEYVEDLTYTDNELYYKGSQIKGDTKYIVSCDVVLLYLIASLQEDFAKLETPLLKKSVERFMSLFEKRAVVGKYNVNMELFKEIFEKVFNKYPTIGILALIVDLFLISDKDIKVLAVYLKNMFEADTQKKFFMYYDLIIHEVKTIVEKETIKFLEYEILYNAYSEGMIDVSPDEVIKMAKEETTKKSSKVENIDKKMNKKDEDNDKSKEQSENNKQNEQPKDKQNNKTEQNDNENNNNQQQDTGKQQNQQPNQNQSQNNNQQKNKKQQVNDEEESPDKKLEDMINNAMKAGFFI